MDFNWSSFLFEIINFLVLVWIVKHFFYRPVCEAIDKRRKTIEQETAKAKDMQTDAEKLMIDYNSRLTIWEEEKRKLEAKLAKEIDEQKKQQLLLLEKQIADEKEKIAHIQEKQLKILMHNNEKQALDQGAIFTAKLLQELSSPEIENKLIDLFLDSINHLSQEDKEKLLNIYNEENPEVLITSAYALSLAQKESIQAAMNKVFSHDIEFKIIQSPDVIAGLRVNIGAYVLRANLADELLFFSDAANGI